MKRRTPGSGQIIPSPSRFRLSKIMQKRGLSEQETEYGWRQSRDPTRGQYESSNLLGLDRNQFTNIIVIQLEDKELPEPISCSFRVRNKEELTLALITKFQLSYNPHIYFYNDLENENIPVEDITILPNPAKLRISKPNEEDIFNELVELLRLKISIKDRRYHLQTYHNCFIGQEMVDCIINENILGQNTSRAEAIEFGEKLRNLGCIQHVVDVKRPFKDKYLFYRFTENDHITRDFSLTTYCWGYGDFIPHIIDCDFSITSVACGSVHVIALTDTGKVYSWGYGDHGQLGLPVYSVDHPMLVNSLSDKNIQVIYAGYTMSGAKCGEKQLFTWGSFDSSSCNNIPKLVPFTDINDNASIISVSFGLNHAACLVSTEGVATKNFLATTLYTWGFNDYGQLGIDNICDEEFIIPVIVQPLSKYCILSVSCGIRFTGILTSDGRAFMWGDNTDEKLGVGDLKKHISTIPRVVKGIKGTIDQLDCGNNFSVAITTKGNVYIWGSSNRFGSIYENFPKRISRIQNASSVCCGEEHFLIRTNENNIHSLYSFGINTKGQLGINTNFQPSQLPMKVELPIDRVIQISAGKSQSIVIITEDIVEVLIAASQKLYGENDKMQRRKLINILSHDKNGIAQISARKILRLESRKKSENRTGRKKSLTRVSLRQSDPVSLERSNSLSIIQRQFEWKQHSTIFSISLSKYHLFDKLNGPVLIYKYFWEDVIINNEGRINARFNIILPESSDFKLNANPLYGVIGKSNQNIQFQIVALSPGKKRDVIFIEIESDGVTYRHFIYFELNCQAQILVPEYEYEQLQGGEILGSGAAGNVSKVNLDGRDVAVKFFLGVQELSVEEINSFRNEMMISSNLSHPNIIDCLGVCTQFPHLALVLEYLPMKDLRCIIPKKLSTEFILRILMDIAEGMIYLHNRMVLHRDLKPDNVLMVDIDINADVCAKLTDFGTSCVVVSYDNNTEVGTARYMPLEVLEPDSNLIYDKRSVDIYSFGVSM